MADDVDVKLGRCVAQRRKRLGLTQARLGAAVGMNYRAIHKLECGAHPLTVSRLIKLSLALGVRPTHFLERVLGDDQARA